MSISMICRRTRKNIKKDNNSDLAQLTATKRSQTHRRQLTYMHFRFTHLVKDNLSFPWDEADDG